jgi:hypothetical protein
MSSFYVIILAKQSYFFPTNEFLMFECKCFFYEYKYITVLKHITFDVIFHIFAI